MRAFEQRKKNNPSNSSFFGPKIQKKLKTGKAGDQFEVEADKVADKVVNDNTPNGGLLQSKAEEEVQQKPISETISSVQSKEMKEEEPVQKKTEKEEPVQKKGEEKEEPVQKKEEEKEPVQKKAEEKEEPIQKKTEEKEEAVQKKTEEKEEPVQKKADGVIQKKEEKKQDSNVEENLNKGGGNPLDRGIQMEMENEFGVDFSPIRIHTDENAVAMCQEMGAQAFTNGVDIYFDKGKYNPNSTQGKKLLAHELTHTLQQGAINKKKE